MATFFTIVYLAPSDASPQLVPICWALAFDAVLAQYRSMSFHESIHRQMRAPLEPVNILREDRTEQALLVQ
jgi:hypothetical protein